MYLTLLHWSGFFAAPRTVCQTSVRATVDWSDRLSRPTHRPVRSPVRSDRRPRDGGFGRELWTEVGVGQSRGEVETEGLLENRPRRRGDWVNDRKTRPEGDGMAKGPVWLHQSGTHGLRHWSRLHCSYIRLVVHVLIADVDVSVLS